MALCEQEFCILSAIRSESAMSLVYDGINLIKVEAIILISHTSSHTSPLRMAIFTAAGIIVTAIQLSLFAVAPAHAEVVKITAPNGKIFYSDLPPESIPLGAQKSIIKSYGEVKVKTPTVATTDLEKSADKKDGSISSELPLSNSDIIKANALIKKQNEEILAKSERDNCEILKKNLANVKIGRVMTVNDKGEKNYLTDDEISAEKRNTEASIATVCK
jgi:hypothetical protein